MWVMLFELKPWYMLVALAQDSDCDSCNREYSGKVLLHFEICTLSLYL